MDLPDSELVNALRRRDGEQTYKGHLDDEGRCRYEAAYPDGACPWCEAVERRAGGD
jgi:hypothetical protein